MTLSINIISPHISKMMWAFIGCFKRCCDRGCGTRIKKNFENAADINVNTKKQT